MRKCSSLEIYWRIIFKSHIIWKNISRTKFAEKVGWSRYIYIFSIFNVYFYFHLFVSVSLYIVSSHFNQNLACYAVMLSIQQCGQISFLLVAMAVLSDRVCNTAQWAIWAHRQTYISQSSEFVIISQLFCRSVSSSSVTGIRETLRTKASCDVGGGSCHRVIDTGSSLPLWLCLRFLFFMGLLNGPSPLHGAGYCVHLSLTEPRHIFHLCVYDSRPMSPAPNNRSIPLCFSARSKYVSIFPAPAFCILSNAGQASSIVMMFM